METPRPWIVTPHQPIERHEENLWSVRSPIPESKGMRRMMMARLNDGQIVFYNGIPLEDAALAELRAWGKPTLVILPHRSHVIDAHAFRERLELKSFAPEAERTEIEKRVPVDGSTHQLKLDDSVWVESLEGSKNSEPILVVKSGGRTSLIFADVFMNIPAGAGRPELAGGPKITDMWKRSAMADAKTVRAHFERLAALPGLHRLIPSHGLIYEGDAASVMRQVAATL